MSTQEEKIVALEQEKQDLLEEYFDKDKNCWKPTTPEQQKALQARYRSIRNQMVFINQEIMLAEKETPDEIKATLFPLVQRRRYQEEIQAGEKQAWTFNENVFHIPDGIGKLEIDGDVFCFHPQEYQEVNEETCGCGFYSDGWTPANPRELREAEAHLQVCQHVVTKVVHDPVHRIKHTRGNWECKGCLVEGTKQPDLPPGLAELATVKWIDWCPNFPEWARKLAPEDVAIGAVIRHGTREAVKKICYAGLMHSQLEWGARENAVSPDDPTRTKIIQHLKIVRMCDTCGHVEVENKTSEWVDSPVEVALDEEAGRVLGFRPEDEELDAELEAAAKRTELELEPNIDSKDLDFNKGE